MSQENKLNTVLATVNDMFEIVHFMRDNMVTKTDLKKEIDGVRSEIEGLRSVMATKKDLASVRLEIEGIRSVMATKKDLAGVQSDIEGIRSVMATRRDLEGCATKRDIERCATKQDLETMNSNLITHIDGFVGMHKGLDLELVSLRSKYQRLESHVQQLAKHTRLKLE